MPSRIVLQCCKEISEHKLNIAFVESATAGRMCAEFSLSPESGKILSGGISCYEVFVKEQILNVPHDLIETFTPESLEVTKSLGQSAAALFKSDITIANTGLIKPGGSEGPGKPVGTMFLYIITPNQELAHKEVFKGDEEEIVLSTIDRAAEIIIEMLNR